jgi:hypothetical protein
MSGSYFTTPKNRFKNETARGIQGNVINGWGLLDRHHFFKNSVFDLCRRILIVFSKLSPVAMVPEEGNTNTQCGWLLTGCFKRRPYMSGIMEGKSGEADSGLSTYSGFSLTISSIMLQYRGKK